MPRYTFACSKCEVVFTKKLKMGNHSSYGCDTCGEDSPRVWEGQGFGFDFAAGSTPGNSGVTKHDFPTSDQAVGADADARWGEIYARNAVKEKVREVGQTHALIRQNGSEGGKPYVEYTAGGESVLAQRRKAMKVYKEVLSIKAPSIDR